MPESQISGHKLLDVSHVTTNDHPMRSKPTKNDILKTTTLLELLLKNFFAAPFLVNVCLRAGVNFASAYLND